MTPSIDNITEIWLPVLGHESKYEVSTIGRVRSLAHLRKGRNGSFRKMNGKVLKPVITARGYYGVGLVTGGAFSLVHRLMCEAFIPNPEGKPQVNHINGNKLDNRIENLEWVTRRENIQHAYDTGLRKNGPNRKLSEDQVKDLRRLYESGDETYENLAKKFCISLSVVGLIIRRKTYKKVA